MIFAPITNEVKKIKIKGTIFIVNKNNNFLSFRLNFGLNLEIRSKHKIKKGTSISICFPNKIKGYDKWFKKFGLSTAILLRP